MIRLLAALAICSPILLADGGALVLQNQSGSLVISVFCSPSPATAGFADISVLVQNAADHQAVQDAHVGIELQKASTRITASATQEQATNKLLYAAQVDLTSGEWILRVHVTTPAATGDAQGTLQVGEPPSPMAAYWPYFAVIPIVIGLFILNRKLKTLRTKRPRR